MAFVDLAENAFEGYGFPDALVAAPQLTYLYLENNALTGDLPSLTNGDPAALEHNVRFKRTRVLSLSKTGSPVSCRMTICCWTCSSRRPAR